MPNCLSPLSIALLCTGISIIACAPSKIDVKQEIVVLAELQKQEQAAHLEN